MENPKRGSFASKIISNRGDYIYLIRGDQDNDKVWIYLMVEQDNIALFQRKLEAIGKGEIDLNQHGEMLYSGFGERPPEKVVRDMRREYIN